MKSELNLDIQGMTCASCVNRIERALKKVPGILEASVNLATEKARVSFEDREATPEKIILAVKKVGYEARPSNPKKTTVEGRKSLGVERLHIAISILLTLPLALPMFLTPFHIHLMPSPMLQLILSSPVQFYFGARFYRGAYSALRARSGNMDLLVAIGTSAAWGLSLYLLLKGEEHLYFEASAVVITLVLLGKYLEARAKQKTTRALEALQELKPESARVLRGGIETEISIADIIIGDLAIVRPGERIPVDGEIIEGETQVDESLITGESLPVDKAAGAKVVGGSINGNGLIKVSVMALEGETMLSRIISMVENAQAAKAPIQRLVDKVSAVFVPVVLVIAGLTLVFTGASSGDWEHAIINAVAVLVIACPCALGLATPTSIMVGTGAAAKAGILIKDAEALETTHSVTTVAFDKTGTLTEGKPILSRLIPFSLSEIEALSILASLQSGSEHPLARAVLERARKMEVSIGPASEVKAIPGIGLEGKVNGESYILGSKRSLEGAAPLTTEEKRLAEECEAQGESVSFLGRKADGKVMAIVSFKDAPKEGARAAVARLRDSRIRTVMISGDNAGSANAVARELGIDEVRAEVLPQDKAAIINELKGQGETVAMVGDGINDAPALASAHVGIAMATGTDVAMHTSGITLMRGDPLLVPEAISVSKRTYAKIRQNLFWAFIYNVIGIPLAALGYLSPVLAGAAMALSSVSVVTNSLLLRRWRPHEHR